MNSQLQYGSRIRFHNLCLGLLLITFIVHCTDVCTGINRLSSKIPAGLIWWWICAGVTVWDCPICRRPITMWFFVLLFFFFFFFPVDSSRGSSAADDSSFRFCLFGIRSLNAERMTKPRLLISRRLAMIASRFLLWASVSTTFSSSGPVLLARRRLGLALEMLARSVPKLANPQQTSRSFDEFMTHWKCKKCYNREIMCLNIILFCCRLVSEALLNLLLVPGGSLRRGNPKF